MKEEGRGMRKGDGDDCDGDDEEEEGGRGNWGELGNGSVEGGEGVGGESQSWWSSWLGLDAST
jgi:hypothetical protein